MTGTAAVFYECQSIVYAESVSVLNPSGEKS